MSRNLGGFDLDTNPTIADNISYSQDPYSISLSYLQLVDHSAHTNFVRETPEWEIHKKLLIQRIQLNININGFNSWIRHLETCSDKSKKEAITYIKKAQDIIKDCEIQIAEKQSLLADLLETQQTESSISDEVPTEVDFARAVIQENNPDDQSLNQIEDNELQNLGDNSKNPDEEG